MAYALFRKHSFTYSHSISFIKIQNAYLSNCVTHRDIDETNPRSDANFALRIVSCTGTSHNRPQNPECIKAP